jgi:purine-nucleoside phosphorylase
MDYGPWTKITLFILHLQPNINSIYMMSKIKEATDFIRSITDFEPVAGIVLGSGLGSFTRELKVEKEIPYGDIPHFPVSTVKGHSGKLIFAELSGKKIVVMAGRFHFY